MIQLLSSRPSTFLGSLRGEGGEASPTRATLPWPPPRTSPVQAASRRRGSLSGSPSLLHKSQLRLYIDQTVCRAFAAAIIRGIAGGAGARCPRHPPLGRAAGGGLLPIKRRLARKSVTAQEETRRECSQARGTAVMRSPQSRRSRRPGTPLPPPPPPPRLDTSAQEEKFSGAGGGSVGRAGIATPTRPFTR